MERLNLKRADANKSLKSLQAILQEPFSVIVRDAASVPAIIGGER